MNKFKISIRKSAFFILLAIATLTMFSISALWVVTEIIKSKKKLAEISEFYEADQCEIIKSEVTNVVSLINYSRKYNNNNKSKNELQNEILDFVSKIRLNHGGYIFINTYDGRALIFDGVKIIGEKNIRDITDPDGLKIFDIELKTPFLKLDYKEAMSKYGSDKPDLRFGMKLIDLTEIFNKSSFKSISKIFNKKGEGKICAIKVEGCSDFSRKRLDDLTKFVSTFGAKGLSFVKYKAGEEFQSSIAKFLSIEEIKGIRNRTNAGEGDIILIVADREEVVYKSLGNLRLKMAKELGLIDETNKIYNFLWVTNFPLLEFNEDEKRYESVHHPFTAPMDEDVSLLESEPQNVCSKAYDLVLNGNEIGGGSIRIHNTELQKNIFRLLGIDDKKAIEKFGFLLEALKYGAPPHGGIAFGMDRLTMILAGVNSIREVIAFPKTQKAICLLTNAPSAVDKKSIKRSSY